MGQRIERALEAYGLSVINKTPVLGEGTRSQEVEQWLKNKSYVDQYVILDDNDFAWSRSLRSHWACCPAETGLTDQLVETAIGMLKGNLIPIIIEKKVGSKSSSRKLRKE